MLVFIVAIELVTCVVVGEFRRTRARCKLSVVATCLLIVSSGERPICQAVQTATELCQASKISIHGAMFAVASASATARLS
jgi:hypothetical protein